MTDLVQMNGVEEPNSIESGPYHTAVNKNYVYESGATEYGSCHADIKMNGLNASDIIESGSLRAEVKMNGVDKSDIIESGSCHVKVKTNDVGKSNMVESGSGPVKNQSTNNCKDEGDVAAKLDKKTSVLSNLRTVQAEGRLDIVEGYNSSSCNDADKEYHQINNSVSDSERMALEKMEVSHESVGGTLKSVADSQSEISSDLRSTPANNRVLPANCDVYSADVSHVGTKLALSPLSAETKLRCDLSVRSRNRENVNDDRTVVLGNHCEGGEAGSERHQTNCQLISSDLPTVHKEGSDTDRQQVPTNCRLISAKLMSDNYRTVHNEGSETDKQRQHGQLPSICDDSDETDRRQRHAKLTCDILPKTCVEMDRNTKCRLSAVDSEGSETDQHQVMNCQSPTVCSEGSETDRCTNCMLTADNFTKADDVDVGTDQKTDRSVHNKGSETDRCQQSEYQLPNVECKFGEAEQSQRLFNSRLPTVHKHQMMVDCDVNLPHSVWTSVVNHNSLLSDDSRDVHTRRRADSSYSTANEVLTSLSS